MNTPWGPSQTQRTIAEGIVSVSTAGHGGIRLSEERARQMYRLLPNFHPYAGGNWLEEDCDWAAAPLCWPEHFDDQDIFNALRTFTRWHEEVAFEAYDQTPQGIEVNRRAKAFEASIAGKWERGGLGSTGPEYPRHTWSVYLYRNGEKKSVVFKDYPTQQFYTDEEIQQAQYTA